MGKGRRKKEGQSVEGRTEARRRPKKRGETETERPAAERWRGADTGESDSVMPVSLRGSLVLSPFLPVYTILDFIYSFIFGCPGSWLPTGFSQLRCMGASLVMERRL